MPASCFIDSSPAPSIAQPVHHKQYKHEQDLWTGLPTRIGFPNRQNADVIAGETGLLSQLHPWHCPPFSFCHSASVSCFLSPTMHPVPYNPVHECFAGWIFTHAPLVNGASPRIWSKFARSRICSWRGVKSTCGIYRLPPFNDPPNCATIIVTFLYRWSLLQPFNA